MSYQTISPNLFVYQDTCRVYAVRSGDQAVLIDFGDGGALDALHEIGVSRVTDILITHHHRDQCQGLPRAAALGIRIWVPEAEQDFFHSADWQWQAREVLNNYNTRQDRFSLLESVDGIHLLRDYAQLIFNGASFTVLPTPGHTTGSVTIMAGVDNQTVAFCGDLIAGTGKLWSLAATQWSYNGGEGLPLTVLSLADLKPRQPDMLLPSHGDPVTDPEAAIDLVIDRCAELMRLRRQNPRLFQFLEKPFAALSPHLLRNLTSLATSYVLISESGKALLVDYGYDFVGAIPAGSGRSTRRPWLYTLPALKRDWGVEQIDAVVPTHFHDDHVAGINLLRAVEGAQVWAAESFVHLLEAPEDYDIPCLWYDPIKVDRVLPLEQSFQWEEYTLSLFPLPGHTRYAVALVVEVDGRRVMFCGDQFRADDGLLWNYVYQNRVSPGDFMQVAELYERICPDLILSGHHEPVAPTPGYYQQLRETSAALERLHYELLPDATAGLGAEGLEVSVEPYQAKVFSEQPFSATVRLSNPWKEPVLAAARLVAPPGWEIEPAAQSIGLGGRSSGAVTFQIRPPEGLRVRRARLAVDISIDGQKLGQQAEMLVTVQ